MGAAHPPRQHPQEKGCCSPDSHLHIPTFDLHTTHLYPVLFLRVTGTCLFPGEFPVFRRFWDGCQSLFPLMLDTVLGDFVTCYISHSTIQSPNSWTSLTQCPSRLSSSTSLAWATLLCPTPWSQCPCPHNVPPTTSDPICTSCPLITSLTNSSLLFLYTNLTPWVIQKSGPVFHKHA